MTYILDSFASIWFYFMFVSFAFGIVGLGFLFYWQYGKPENPNKYLKRGGLLFGQVFITWIIGFGMLWVVQNQAKNELQTLITNDQVEISVMGQEIGLEEEIELRQILKAIMDVPAHHSHPTKGIKIEVENNNEITNVYLKKDSERENEYWVFWDKYKTTKNNEIGRITNDEIKKYGS